MKAKSSLSAEASGGARGARYWGRVLAGALALALALGLAACAAKAEPRFPTLGAGEISAEALWRRIAVESPYADWGAWPGHEGVQPGQAPHGPFHRIYVNAPLREALPIASKKVPAGGIIVKENMNADAKVTAITVMAKVEGFDPRNGDWFWARFDLEGKAAASGSVRGCFVCHEGMKDNDYVIVRRLDAK